MMNFPKCRSYGALFLFFAFGYKNTAPLGLNNFRSWVKTLGSSGTKIQAEAIDFYQLRSLTLQKWSYDRIRYKP
jgi:hypothetical protein